MSGAYIVVEGIDDAAKQAVIAGISDRLHELDASVVLLDSHPAKNATSQAIAQIVRSKRRSLSSEGRVLMRGAQLVESLRAMKPAMQKGTIHLATKGHIDFLVRAYYGGDTTEDYHALNAVVSFAAKRTPPTLVLLLDSTVPTGQSSDDANAARQEKLRAGFLWEAKQRGLPIIYAADDAAATLDQAWRHVAAVLHLEQEAVQRPTAVAEVLATSPAAKLLKQQKQSETIQSTAAYYVPTYLPDNLQCDYCDEVDRLLGARKSLLRQLAEYIRTQDNLDAEAARALAEDSLRGLLPVASAGKEFITALSHVRTSHEQQLDEIGSRHYEDRADSVRLQSYQPLNELDLVPSMLASPKKKPRAKLNFERWTYEAKLKALEEYMDTDTPKIVLGTARYEWACFTDTASLLDLSGVLDGFEQHIQLDAISPRYGYQTPVLIEEAGLADAYDAVFDLSLQAHSNLSASGHTTEAQYLTLLGHKQPWQLSLPGDMQCTLLQATDHPLNQHMLEQLAERHPLLARYAEKKVDTTTTRA